MRISVNENFHKLDNNYLFCEISKRVKACKEKNPEAKIINLGIGDVTLPLGRSAVEAMKKACDEQSQKDTFHGYSPDTGYDFLKNAISNYYKKYGVSVDKDEIFISDGAKSDIGNLTDLFGDNTVYITDPVYPVYLDSNIMSSRKAVFMRATEENGFLPMPRAEYKTGIYYLCSPNNPTGAVYSREKLDTWVNFALETGSLIIFDAAYEAFIKGDYPHSVYEIKGAKECAIEVCSFSKTAGFTGIRCGYTIVPKKLACGNYSLNKMWRRRQSTKFNGVSYITQRGAEASYSDEGVAEWRKNIDCYMKNATRMAEFLKKRGIEYTGAYNAPYLWVKCPEGYGSWDFFDYLLEKCFVVVTPGEGFGKCGEGYFRISSFCSPADMSEAIKRLGTLL